MADGMTLVAVGGPWLLGTCVAAGTVGMAVTAGVGALWRRLAAARPQAVEPVVEEPHEQAVLELAALAGPGARLRAVCLASGMPEAAVEELLARHLASAGHPSRAGGRGGSEVAVTAVTQELPVLRLLPSPGDEVTQEIPTVSAEVAARE